MSTQTEALSSVPIFAVSPAVRRQSRLLTGAVARIFAADFAAMCSFYLLLSVVPLYSTERGLGTAGAGLSTGVLMFAAVAGEMATPLLAARIGFRRLLMGGLVLLGVPALGFPAASSLLAVMLLSVVRGLGFAVVVVAVSAMAAAAIPAERRGEGLGALGVVAMLPAVLTLPLGVWMAGVAGYAAVFAIAAAAALLAVIPIATLREAGIGESHQGLGASLRRPAILRPTLVFTATAVASGVVVAFLPSAASREIAAAALLIQAATATLARWFAGRHSDRHGPVGMLLPAAALCALGIGAAALTGSGIAVLGGMAVFGTGFGIAQAASLNTMLARVSAAHYGAVSAIWNAAYDLGWGAGATGIGVVASTAGYPAAFLAAALLVLAVLPLARRGRG